MSMWFTKVKVLLLTCLNPWPESTFWSALPRIIKKRPFFTSRNKKESGKLFRKNADLWFNYPYETLIRRMIWILLFYFVFGTFDS